jgi:hypothetical protein
MRQISYYIANNSDMTKCFISYLKIMVDLHWLFQSYSAHRFWKFYWILISICVITFLKLLSNSTELNNYSVFIEYNLYVSDLNF